MKKLTFLMTVVLCMLCHGYAYGSQLNPYAYDVNATLNGTNIELSYKLNAPADSTHIMVYCNDAVIDVQRLTEASENTAGLHNAIVDLSAYNQAGNCEVGICVHGASPAVPTQLKNGTSAVTYSLYHPKGVAIDKNPASPYFGRILTDECMLHSKSSGYISCPEKNGIYAFDPAFQQIHNGSGYAFKGGLTYYTTMAYGSTTAYAPYRIRISQSGRIFVTMQDDHHGLIYEASADLQTFTPIVSDYTINGLQAMNASLDLKDNLDGSISLLALNCNSSGIGYNNTGWELTEFTIAVDGTISTRVVMDADSLISVLGFQKNVDPIEGTDPAGNHWRTVLTPGNTQFQYAADGGYWFINSRANDYEAAFAHVKADGTWDMVMARIEGSTAAAGSGDFYGGAGFVEIGDKVFVGMNRYTSANGKIGVFTVDYSGTNTTVTLDSYITAEVIGRNINDFAYDPAYNLYAVGNSGEKIIAVALPYSGEVETPVMLPKSIMLPLVENVYEFGDNQGWATDAGVAMTNVAPNVFEGEFTFANATSYFTFASAVGADWDAVNPHRYGASNQDEAIANGDVKALHLGWANSFAIPAGKYRLTVDLNAMTVTVKQLWDHLYLFDNLSGDWVFGDGIDVTKTGENIFEIEYGIPEGKYIIFSTTHGADWDAVNAGRLYIESDGNYWVDGDSEAGISATSGDDKTLLFKSGGRYTFTVDLNTRKIGITQLSAYVEITSAGYATYYNSKKAYVIPADMSGYVFNFGTGLTEEYAGGSTVEAGRALVLGSDVAAIQELVFTDPVAPRDLASQLHGSDAAGMTNAILPGDYVYYGLSLAQGDDPATVGFYYMVADGAAFENGAHKAFLALPAGTPAPERILFHNNDATNIENVEGMDQAVKFIENGQMFIKKNGVVYDMMGHAVK